MKISKKHVFLGALLLAFSAIPFILVQKVNSQVATGLVISEVQIAGDGTGNSGLDFIEIYNPTSQSISLDGLRLAKRASTATASASIVAFTSDENVAAYSYYLWCNTALTSAINCDKNTSATISDNNTIAILNGSLAEGVVVDAVTFGSPVAPFGEGTFLTAPEPGTSVERKAKSTSTAQSMIDNLLDGLLGNGFDSNNNASDFIVRDTPQPQSAASASEQLANETPTSTPSETLTPTPTETQTLTPTPTVTVTLTPTPTQTTTTTLTPTSSPTNTPSPTMTPFPSTTPTVTPTPYEELIGTFHFPSRTVQCKIVYKPYKVLFLSGFMPTFSCSNKTSPNSTAN